MLTKRALYALALLWPLGAMVGVLGSCNSTTLGGDPVPTDDGGTINQPGTPPKIPGCTGACVVNRSCPAAMGSTKIKGTVRIPSGMLPLYNAKVYIPTGDAIPDPPTTGVSCDRCDAQQQDFATTTDVNGNFTLDNIPSGSNIPLIIRVGKWRRVITLPAITDCTTTTLDSTQTRLPRNQSEGNIPKIALTTGALDAMECVLRTNKLGLDDKEFTNPTGSGRVNLYAGVTGTDQYDKPSMAFPTANPWWDNVANWNQYDIVMLSCEGQPSSHDLTKKSVAARQAIQTYLGLGGRVFASHWHNVWIQKSVALPAPSAEPPLTTVAQFIDPLSMGNGYSNDGTTDEATINTGFAKGQALQQWLQNAMALNAQGKLPIKYVRATVMKQNNNVMPAKTNPDPALTQSWITLTKANGTLDAQLANPPSQYFSFNMPLSQPAAAQCGQMVFTDLHLSGAPGGQPGDHSGAGTALAFPKGCTTSGLTPQEMALIFLLFDLTNCLQPTIG